MALADFGEQLQFSASRRCVTLYPRSRVLVLTTNYSRLIEQLCQLAAINLHLDLGLPNDFFLLLRYRGRDRTLHLTGKRYL